MITSEQAAKLRELINAALVAKNDYDAEIATGTQWEKYETLLKEANDDLHLFINAITQPGSAQ